MISGVYYELLSDKMQNENEMSFPVSAKGAGAVKIYSKQWQTLFVSRKNVIITTLLTGGASSP